MFTIERLFMSPTKMIHGGGMTCPINETEEKKESEKELGILGLW